MKLDITTNETLEELIEFWNDLSNKMENQLLFLIPGSVLILYLDTACPIFVTRNLCSSLLDHLDTELVWYSDPTVFAKTIKKF